VGGGSAYLLHNLLRQLDKVRKKILASMYVACFSVNFACIVCNFNPALEFNLICFEIHFDSCDAVRKVLVCSGIKSMCCYVR
jgi:hypothetical protein